MMAEHMPAVLQPLQFLSPLKSAPESILATWPRPTADWNRTAAGVKVYNSTAKPGDVLVSPHAAGILKWILTDGSHGAFLLQRLELVPSTAFNNPFQHFPDHFSCWQSFMFLMGTAKIHLKHGHSAWYIINNHGSRSVSLQDPYTMPAWWGRDGERLICLH